MEGAFGRKRKKRQFFDTRNKKALQIETYKAYKCAQDWNRTSTPVKAADFESAASTNSATWA